MTITRTLSAAVLTIGVVVSTLAGPASAAQLPVPHGNHPLPVSGTDSIASPGDPFIPSTKPKPKIKIYEYAMSCEIDDGKFANGASSIKMKNTGVETIPAGANIVVTFPDGTKKTFTTPSEIKPGASVSIMGPPDATPDNFSCSAGAWAFGPNIDFGVPEGGRIDPNSPPEIVCAFTVVNGKLVVSFKNVGGQPLTGFQRMHAFAEDGSLTSFDHVGEVDLPPGKSMHMTVDVPDPSAYEGKECNFEFYD